MTLLSDILNKNENYMLGEIIQLPSSTANQVTINGEVFQRQNVIETNTANYSVDPARFLTLGSQVLIALPSGAATNASINNTSNVICLTNTTTVYRSTDSGSTYTSTHAFTSTSSMAITNSGTGIWVILGDTTNSRKFSNDDGLTWNDFVSFTGATNSRYRLAYGRGAFYAFELTSTGASPKIHKSTDGTNWTLLVTLTVNAGSAQWSTSDIFVDNNYIIAISSTSVNSSFWSINETDWFITKSGTTSTTAECISKMGSNYVVVGGGSVRLGSHPAGFGNVNNNSTYFANGVVPFILDNVMYVLNNENNATLTEPRVLASLNGASYFGIGESFITDNALYRLYVIANDYVIAYHPSAATSYKIPLTIGAGFLCNEAPEGQAYYMRIK